MGIVDVRVKGGGRRGPDRFEMSDNKGLQKSIVASEATEKKPEIRILNPTKEKEKEKRRGGLVVGKKR